MRFLCFSRQDRRHRRTFDRSLEPRRTLLDELEDNRQRSSLSAPTPANIGISGSNNASPPAPIGPSVFSKEGLIQLAVPRGIIETEETYDLDVIAIHGLNGHPRDTWTSGKKEGQVFWLQDFLPKALPGARIYTYGYNSNIFFSKSTGDIGSYAKGLLDHLILERKSTAQSSRPIAFICHSLGGLVCKKSLIIANEKRDRYQTILDSTKAVFFFGTPHRGSDFADFVNSTSPILKLFDNKAIEIAGGKGRLVREDLIKQLRAESKELEDLCSAFVERAHKIPYITTFYELNKLYGNIIVAKKSATIGVANEDVVGIAGDHRQICRIKDESEMPYRRIVQDCQSLGIEVADRSRLLDLHEQQCLDSLAVSSFRDLHSSKTSPAKHTCEWILSLQEFNVWRRGLRPLLWISGELGCGKTTLMSFLKYQIPGHDPVINQNRSKLVKRSTVCSFFCDDRDGDLANATVLLQGLILDVVSQRHDLIHHVLKHFQPSYPWSYNQLWRIFQTILDDPHMGDVCVIIDALDECNRRDRQNFLRDLVKYLEKRSEHRNTPINFVVSSRPATIGSSPELKAYSSYFMLDQDVDLRAYIAADIRRFVLDDLLSDNQFASRDDPKRSVKLEALADIIATKSEGSFLWASLILEELHSKSVTMLGNVEKFISECPPDLYGVYFKSLKEIDSDDRKLVIKAFQIILAARSPMTVANLKTALIVEKHYKSLESLQRAVDRLDNITNFFEFKLGSLIRIDKSIITLRHQSVKDFLLNQIAAKKISQRLEPSDPKFDASEVFSMSMNEAESTLAASCINFLNIEDFNKKRSSKAEDMEMWEDSGFGAISLSPDHTPKSLNPTPQDYNNEDSDHWNPFFSYAASYWGSHYASSESADEELKLAALNLSTRPNILFNWSHHFRRSHWGDHNLPESLDTLIVAAYYGQISLAKQITSTGDFGSSWAAALTWAARMGHANIVKHFIELGVPCKGEFLDGRSAFSWATAGGFLEIVNILLNCDESLINIRDTAGCSPLILAVLNEHMEVVERLLQSQIIDVNLYSNEGLVPISFAVKAPDPSAAKPEIFFRLLRDSRVDITVRDKHGRSCLSYAAECGATDIIQELLDCRERQDAINRLLDDKGDNNGVSSLSHATWMGHVSTVRLLCKTKKIDTQLQSVNKLDGDNAFALAAKRGHVKVIKELGKYYPSGINSLDITGRTPLSTAMWQRNLDVLRALLDYGADPNLPDYAGKTPVSYGVENIESVRLLVEEYGADINVPDHSGHTALWWARTKVVNMQTQLRDLGARL